MRDVAFSHLHFAPYRSVRGGLLTDIADVNGTSLNDSRASLRQAMLTKLPCSRDYARCPAHGLYDPHAQRCFTPSEKIVLVGDPSVYNNKLCLARSTVWRLLNEQRSAVMATLDKQRDDAIIWIRVLDNKAQKDVSIRVKQVRELKRHYRLYRVIEQVQDQLKREGRYDHKLLTDEDGPMFTSRQDFVLHLLELLKDGDSTSGQYAFFKSREELTDLISTLSKQENMELVRESVNGVKRPREHQSKYVLSRGWMSNECSFAAPPQCGDSCGPTAVWVLASKIQTLYRQLEPDTRIYIDTLRTCPRVGTDTCARMPRKIREQYQRLSGEKYVAGGATYATILFCALLHANDISYSYTRQLYDSSPWHVPNSVKGQFAILNISQYQKQYDEAVRHIQEFSRSHSGVLQGGIIAVHISINPYGSENPDSGAHVMPFTMCNHKVLMCNWGECDDSGHASRLGLHPRTPVIQIMLLLRPP